MKEHPILFSGPMVRAILDGTKTQTRRVIRPLAPWESTDEGIDIEVAIGNIKCPFGVKGDVLWVREAFGYMYPSVDGPESEGITYKDKDYLEGRELTLQECDIKYRATEPNACWMGDDGEPCTMWKPSIHMPRWASRINLEITGIRAERVQDITNEDAIAEGCPGEKLYPDEGYSEIPPDPYEEFAILWDPINEKRGYGWNENPWVWVIEFHR